MGRRGANEGSIYRRNRDGKWVAVANLGYASGKPRRKTFVGKIRAEVQRELTRALRDREWGLPVRTERQTLADYLDAWLRDSVRPSRRPRTHERYEQAVRLHIVPEIGRIELSKLTPQHVQRLVANMLQADTRRRPCGTRERCCASPWSRRGSGSSFRTTLRAWSIRLTSSGAKCRW